MNLESIKPKLLPIESLRGLAAICVVLYHFHSLSPLTNNFFIRHAYLMVDLFFVLSGCVISLNYKDKISTWRQLWEFQNRRFWRLYPLHLLMLVTFLIFEIAKYYFVRISGIESPSPPFSNNTFAAFIHNCFLTQSFLSRNTFNYPSWSISTEFYTYLIFGIILLIGHKRIGMISLFVIAISWLSLNKNPFNISGYFTIGNMARCFVSFFAGVVVQEISNRRPHFQIRGWGIVSALLIVIMTVIGLGGTSLESMVPFIFAMNILIILKTKSTSVSYRIFTHPYLVRLGTISYSIYMVHAAVWSVINQILRFVLKASTFTTEEGGLVTTVSSFNGTVATLLGLFVIVFISHFTYKYIENPFRRGLPYNYLPASKLNFSE